MQPWCELSLPAQKHGPSNAARRNRSLPDSVRTDCAKPLCAGVGRADHGHPRSPVADRGFLDCSAHYFCRRREKSRFVSFHALQALLLQVLYLFLMGLGVVFWFGAVVLTMILHAGGNSSSPPAFLIFMPLLWVDWMSVWGAMVVVAILVWSESGPRRMGRVPVSRATRAQNTKTRTGRDTAIDGTLQ